MLGHHLTIPGYEVALHRALTEPILLAGAPRSFAILNGTLAASIGLGLRLWIAGLLIWLAGGRVFAARLARYNESERALAP
jgi:type IV secretion system protein VirB3